MRWARSNLTEKDFDVELLMLYLQRSIVPENLVGRETVVRFKFTDIEVYPDWWIVISDDKVDLCVSDPGKDIDIYFTTTVRDMASIWMGDCSYKRAIREGALKLVGDEMLTRNIGSWMKNSIYVDLPAASEI